MPIDDAMKRVVSGAGLPARPTTGKVDDYGISIPTDASSGRTWVQLK